MIVEADVVRSLHKHVERMMAKQIDIASKPCGRGCNWCCYLRADCSLAEARVIAGYIDRSLPPQVRALIEILEQRWHRIHGLDHDWFGYTMAEVIDIDAMDELFKDNCMEHRKRARETWAPCPYLLAGVCAVYAVRPVVCRTAYPWGDSADPCDRGDEVLAGFDGKALAENCFRMGLDYTDQGRIPDQVRRARRER